MLTKQQKSCIEALCTSPMAFSLFIDKQYNKRAAYQYVNKLWPMKIAKKEKKVRVQDNELVKATKGLINILKNIPADRKSGVNCEDLEIVTHMTNLDTAKVGNLRGCVDREYGEILRWAQGGGNYLNIEVADGITAITIDEEGLYRFYPQYLVGSGIAVIRFSRNYRNGISPAIDETIRRLCIFIEKIQESKEERKQTGKSQNIGLEFEYSGSNMSELTECMISTGAISFDSGYDGNSSSRLRENRLRIDGTYGLKALYILLNELNAHQQIDVNSGVHAHIDCSFGYKKDRRESIKEKLRANNLELVGTKNSNNICGIFNVGSLSAVRSDMRICDEFETIEFRMFQQTWNYTKIIIQILTSIHIVNRLYKDLRLDEDYLGYLNILMKKANGLTT